MLFDSAISRIRTGVSSDRGRARSRIARQAYSAFAEIFMDSSMPFVSVELASRRKSELAAVERVQAAFGLGLARPSAGSLVVALVDGPGAGPAADRGISLVVERVVGDVVGHDKRPDVALGPLQERVDLHEVELRVPTDNVRLRPVSGLVGADGGDPGVVAFDGLPERQDLAIPAASVGVGRKDRSPVRG